MFWDIGVSIRGGIEPAVFINNLRSVGGHEVRCGDDGKTWSGEKFGCLGQQNWEIIDRRHRASSTIPLCGGAMLPWGVGRCWLDLRAAGIAGRGQQRGFG